MAKHSRSRELKPEPTVSAIDGALTHAHSCVSCQCFKSCWLTRPKTFRRAVMALTAYKQREQPTTAMPVVSMHAFIHHKYSSPQKFAPKHQIRLLFGTSLSRLAIAPRLSSLFIALYVSFRFAPFSTSKRRTATNLHAGSEPAIPSTRDLPISSGTGRTSSCGPPYLHHHTRGLDWIRRPLVAEAPSSLISAPTVSVCCTRKPRLGDPN